MKKLLLCALLSLPTAALPTPGGALGPVLLDDFSQGIRDNSATPADDLWQSYLGADSSQTYGVTGGEFWNHGGPTDFYWQFYPPPYTWPGGFVQHYVMSGTFDAAANRMRFKFKCNINMTRRSDGGGAFDLGTYVKHHGESNPNYQGQHYYHTFNPNIYSGRWLLVEVNQRPQHIVGGGVPGVDPEWTNPTTGAAVHYFDGLTRWYFGNTNLAALLNATCNFDDFYFATDSSGSPDDSVATIVATYSGTRYEVSWQSIPNVNVTYNVRYSTASLKTNGFSSGTDGGTTTNPGNDNLGTFWASPSMSEQSGGLYVGIQRNGQSQFTEIFVPNFSDSDSTAPSVSISTSDPSAISADSLTVTGTASDAVGVSGCKWRIGSAPNASNGTACTGTTSFSCATSGYSQGANTLYVGCYDAAANYGSDSITVNLDSIAPSLSGVSPTGDQVSVVTSIALALTTDEAATCRYDLNGVSDYDLMTNYTSTGNTSHSATVSVLPGRVYVPVAKCRDAAGNTSAAPSWRFAIPANPKQRIKH